MPVVVIAHRIGVKFCVKLRNLKGQLRRSLN